MKKIEIEGLESRIETLTLAGGSHRNAEDGMCLLEAASYLAGEPFSDHPDCVCPVLAAFGRRLNDSLASDEERNELLRPRLLKLLNTAGDTKMSLRRSVVFLDGYIRTCAPLILDVFKLTDHAAALRALPEITGPLSEEAQGAIRAANDAVAAVAARLSEARALARARARALDLDLDLALALALALALDLDLARALAGNLKTAAVQVFDRMINVEGGANE